jgi:hypothetical protein
MNLFFRYTPFLILLVLAIMLSSCMDELKDDEMIEPIPIPEGVKIGNVELGPKYTNTAFYSLSENAVVKTGTTDDYDLAFESLPDGWHILLNTSRFMHAASAETKNFEEVSSHSGLQMNFDPSGGDLDSTAVGNWFTINGADTVYSNSVYVVDMGIDQDGNPMGYKKVVFLKLSAGSYTIRHANLDGTEDFTSEVPKDETVNFVGFNFEKGGEVVHFQPESQNWELFIGQYTTLLYAGTEPYPYVVRGVLTNRTGVQSHLLGSEKTFEEVGYDDAAALTFDDKLDNIGHEWKDYDLEQGFYSVETEQVYIIRALDGSFYKMHFLSYFNANGENGYPQFEFKKLVP